MIGQFGLKFSTFPSLISLVILVGDFANILDFPSASAQGLKTVGTRSITQRLITYL